VIGYGLDDRSFVFDKHKNFSVCQRGDHPAACPIGISFFAGIKQLELEADHSLPSDSDVMKALTYAPTPKHVLT
jgi:hypothetical protein